MNFHVHIPHWVTLPHCFLEISFSNSWFNRSLMQSVLIKIELIISGTKQSFEAYIRYKLRHEINLLMLSTKLKKLQLFKFLCTKLIFLLPVWNDFHLFFIRDGPFLKSGRSWMHLVLSTTNHYFSILVFSMVLNASIFPIMLF